MSPLGHSSLRSALLVTLGLLGCSSSSEDASTSPTSSPADGKATCYAVCDRQANLKCAQIGASFLETCRAICDDAYAKAPAECQTKRAAYDACSHDDVTYACSAAGSLSVSPTGACATQAEACLACSSTASYSCWGVL